MTDTLHSIYMALQDLSKPDYNCFIAEEIPSYDMHKFGISNEGFPVFFITSKYMTSSMPDISLELISIQFNQLCKLKLTDTSDIKESRYTLIALKTADIHYVDYFIDIVEIIIAKLGDSPDQRQLQDEIQKLIDLFRAFNAPPKKKIQGLWAELFLIKNAHDSEYLLKSWHSSTNDIYDFNDGKDKIEVKSTSKPQRIHRFSYDQIIQSEGVLIASIYVIETGVGKSIYDLKRSIETRIHALDLRFKLSEIIFQTLGSDFNKFCEMTFDYQEAENSFKLFYANNIPTIEKQYIPPEISHIHFDCDLSQIADIPDTKNLNSKLYRSI